LGDDVLENGSTLKQVPSQIVKRLFVREMMILSMRRNFMAATVNFSDQAGRLFRVPAQCEKGGLHTESVEKVNECVRIFFKTPILPMPLRMADIGLEVLDLEPVLKVNGDQDSRVRLTHQVLQNLPVLV